VDLGVPLAFVGARRPIRGKKAWQKLTYFAHQLGLPVKCSFSLYLYGPYSYEAAVEYSDLVGTEVFRVDADGYTLVGGSYLNRYLENHHSDVQQYREKLEKLDTLFGHLSPLELELYATTHFLGSYLLRVTGRLEESEVIREVRKAKGSKFSADEIRKAFHDLYTWGLFAPR